jgi:hypothetical protein
MSKNIENNSGICNKNEGSIYSDNRVNGSKFKLITRTNIINYIITFIWFIIYFIYYEIKYR